MARLTTSMLALALGAAAALGLVACGSGDSADLLPGKTASEISSNLDQVEQLAGEGDCIGAQDAALEVSSQVQALEGVDRKLKQALAEGATRLTELVAACEEETSEETAPAIETAEEPAAVEKPKKTKKPPKTKPEKTPKQEPAEPAEPELPPQAEGEGKGPEEGEGEAPAGETETPSGGVSPGAPAGSE